MSSLSSSLASGVELSPIRGEMKIRPLNLDVPVSIGDGGPLTATDPACTQFLS